MNAKPNRRRAILITLLKVQALIGAGFLLWIFFAGDRADEQYAETLQIRIDTSTMATDTLTVDRQKNYDLVVIKPSLSTLQQLASLTLPPKTTSSEPPLRDYRISATIKVFALARIDDHYLLSGRDHWQRDQVCNDFKLQSDVMHNNQMLAFALVCRQAGRNLVYDIAGRSLQADIADLEMPPYRQQQGQQEGDVVIVSR